MRSTLLVLHILLLVAWLGIDVGVFTSSFFIRRRGLGSDARIELRRLMRGLDLAPRLSLVLMMPVGLGLASIGGYGTIPDAVVLSVTVVALVWTAASVWSFRRVTVLGVPRRDDVTAAQWFRRADLALRLVAAVGFGAFGLGSLAGLTNMFAADFVALKAVLFALIVLAGLHIRSAAKPFTPALRRIVEEGEQEEQLATMDVAMRRVYPAVLFIWGTLVAMTVVAVIRPSIG